MRKPWEFQSKHHFECRDLQFLQHLWVQQPHRSTDWDVYGFIMNLLCPPVDVRWSSQKLLLTKSTATPQLNSKFTHLVFIASQGTVSFKTYDNNTTLILPWNSCSLLKQAPFYIYNLVTDPEPYITACTNTLCNYPMVDGLGCQFIEAYAKSCRLQLGKKLTDWRPAVSCRKIRLYCGVSTKEMGRK